MKKYISIVIILLSTATIFFPCNKGSNSALKNDTTNSLPIPPVLSPYKKNKNSSQYRIVVKSGLTEFFRDKPVLTYGYNSDVLGPVIRVRRGEVVKIQVKNSLREYTTVHWHGLLVPGNMDGGPHQVIAPDGTWNAEFKIDQPAATAWYHPHGLGTTAIQVYKGLAGMIIIDDDTSENLQIPKDYGRDDIPLIIQDRRFDESGYPVYLTSMRDIMEGMKGDVILVNGKVEPTVSLKRGIYRFRILNGSNARKYTLRFSGDHDFYQIASDGGFLNKPVKMKSLSITPGERAEILVKFINIQDGDYIYLNDGDRSFLKIIIRGDKNDITGIPEKLVNIGRIPKTNIASERFFSLAGMGHHVSINGKQMNMNRIDETVRLNSKEIWEIRSSSGSMGMGMMNSQDVYHNFHIHGVQFQVLSRSNEPVPENERGWKDTIFIENESSARIIMRFFHKGVFMYHCHILEHEDNGMMGQFQVK